MVESRHRGFITVVDIEGQRIAGTGDPGMKTYLRSSAKPFQCLPVISSGAADHFQFTARELAVMTGSHSGEPMHLEAVMALLEKIGATESDLQCGAHVPFDEATARQLAAADRPPRTLHNNCSGKHAGLLGLSKYLKAPLAEYLQNSHPVQQEILRTLAEFTGLRIEEMTIAIDGCSAPVFGMSLEAMALSYARLAAARLANLAPSLIAASERLVAAMTEYPEMVGGTVGRLDTDLMRVARGRIISKVGAEGLQLIGVLPDGPGGRAPRGLGIAVKIEDGDSQRARNPAVIETLRQLGLLDDEQLAKLSSYAHVRLYNHRRAEVGEVRTCFRLA